MNTPSLKNKNDKEEPEGNGQSSGNSDLLLVIDMQNAYTEDGPWSCPHMDRATDRIITLIQSGQFERIIFTRFEAPRIPAGTWENYNTINRDINEDPFLNEIIPQLLPYTDIYPVYTKSTYSSMSVPEIKMAFTDCIKRGSSLVLTGVVSECCVLATAFQAIDMGCPVIYLSDACAGSSDELGEAVINVLKGLDYAQTTILNTAEYLERAGTGQNRMLNQHAKELSEKKLMRGQL